MLALNVIVDSKVILPNQRYGLQIGMWLLENIFMNKKIFL